MYITFVAFAALASRTLFPCVSISAFNCTASLLSTDSVPPTINKYNDDNHRQHNLGPIHTKLSGNES